MCPLPTRPLTKPLVNLLLAGLAAIPDLRAQQDGPAIDVNQMIQALRAIRDQQTAQIKTQKQNALQQINAVANSPERAIQFWEEAIRATQFDGMAKEGAQFRAWKEGEGEALKERLVANAVHLHLTWLALTLQRSAGVPVKDLLPAVLSYTKELSADQAAIDALSDNLKLQKEAAVIAPGGKARPLPAAPKKTSDADIKKAHDSILKHGLAGSPVVKWMNLTDVVNVPKWETNPSDLDGIFDKVALPEFRLEKDQRALEYWDLRMKREADAATRTKLAYEVDKFNTQRRPALLWNRAQELVALGFKNRAVSDMFTLIKTYPTHPDADDWMSKLEQILTPPPPAAAPDSPGAAAPPAAAAAQ
jgi:hypothetical protein